MVVIGSICPNVMRVSLVVDRLKQIVKNKTMEELGYYKLEVSRLFKRVDNLRNENKNLKLENEELKQKFSLYGVVASEKTFNIHKCINEISKDASRRGVLVYDLSKDNSFRYNCKKAIDKMLYKK
jgi:regulator of replication initiation timing